MRIAFDMLITEQEHGEALYFTCMLLDKLALLDQSNEYIVITAHPQEYRLQASQPNITLYPLKSHSRLGPLTQHQLLLPGVLQHIRPDIVHVADHAAPIGWHGLLVIAIHNTAFLEEQYRSSRLHAWLYWNYALHESMHRAQCIITTSEHVRLELLKRWPVEQSRLRVISRKTCAEETLQIYQELAGR